MSSPPPRVVTLVVLDQDGEVAGVTRSGMTVETPWWPEARPVVAAARETLGLAVVVLRLLEAHSDRAAGGDVTYLVEALEPIGARARAGLERWPGTLVDDPLRQSWARPGGPRADLDWAAAALAREGRDRAGAAEQIRTWNLSSLWRIPTTTGEVWLKHVPPFFGHEGAVLERLAHRRVPRVVARDGPLTLLEAIPGIDLYDVDAPVLESLVMDLVAIQTDLANDAAGLLELGLPDWRAESLAGTVAETIARTAPRLPAEDAATLDAFLATLDDRLARLAAAGLPDTIVHGDFHPGNARGIPDDRGSLTLLDWGDSGVGHPLLDQPAFLDRIPPEAVDPIRRVWRDAWLATRPGSDPERASSLLAPIAAARQAVIYRGFLDRIEASEHVYHRRDPELWLQRTAALVREESRAARLSRNSGGGLSRS